jgi:hypothetical protein
MVAKRRTIPWILAGFLAAGCDLTPTEIEGLGEADLERMVAQTTPPGPGRALWQHFIENLDAPAIDAPALPGLDSLFQLSAAGNAAGEAETSARAAHGKLLNEAWRAIERGDMDSGEAGLTAARTYQAETVVQSLGAGTPLVMITLVGRSLHRLDAAMDLRSGTARQPRFDAMSSTARDLLADARQALGRGESALALDLATHAAGIANAMQDLLRDR